MDEMWYDFEDKKYLGEEADERSKREAAREKDYEI